MTTPLHFDDEVRDALRDGAPVVALESTIDELARQLGLDPIELRLRNYAENDPKHGRPWSSKGLRRAYERGADLIGWSDRRATPRAHREGDWYVGYGMASSFYPTYVWQGSARAIMNADGTAEIRSSLRLTCTADAWRAVGRLEADWEGGRVASRGWDVRVPRRLS